MAWFITILKTILVSGIIYLTLQDSFENDGTVFYIVLVFNVFIIIVYILKKCFERQGWIPRAWRYQGLNDNDGTTNSQQNNNNNNTNDSDRPFSSDMISQSPNANRHRDYTGITRAGIQENQNINNNNNLINDNIASPASHHKLQNENQIDNNNSSRGNSTELEDVNTGQQVTETSSLITRIKKNKQTNNIITYKIKYKIIYVNNKKSINYNCRVFLKIIIHFLFFCVCFVFFSIVLPMQ